MLIRLVGALLLLLGGLALGLTAARELSQRVKVLNAWADALLLLEGELAFTLPPMPQLLETLREKALPPAGEALGQVLTGLEKLGEKSFAQIWAQALTAHSGLEGEDLAPLLRLGEALGRYDREEQGRAIEAARSRLLHREAEGREELSRKGRAYGALGLTLGAFLMILLL